MKTAGSFKCLFFIAVIGLFSMVLSACSSTKMPEMKLAIQSSANLNPNIYAQSSPVVVTFYELKSETAFQQADFFALYNKPASTLGSDLLDKYEIEIQPDQKQVVHTTVSPVTNYIGVVAAFREPDQATWRQLIQVKPGKKVKLVVDLTEQNVSARLD